jgi:alginate O-acetyltransferase complex protein AlgI
MPAAADNSVSRRGVPRAAKGIVLNWILHYTLDTMAFNSFQFLVFFPAAAAIYYALPLRGQRVFLLVASYYFYMSFKPEYAIILAASTIIDYLLARRISARRHQPARKRLLLAGIVHNIGLLAALKYLNFFNDSMAALLKSLHILYDFKGLEFLVPVGISYYTFKKLSYLIDVYRENQEAEKSVITFALYVSFFPAVMSGPIDRAKSLLPQFCRKHGIDYRQVTDGLKLMAWGFFKKLVIADRLAAFVNRVYDTPTQYEGLSLIMATVYFSFQVYCDFSGYTDIARGAGKILGFELMENFDRPYFSRSMVEFWKRWHISLSTWLMDYLFLPIAYAVSRRLKQPYLLKIRAESWAYVAGIVSTMLLCGLWHGAAWTFVLWGGLHGLYLAVSFATRKTRRKWTRKLQIKKHSFIRHAVQVTMTFSLVTFAWIFFRANSLADAGYIVTHLFSGWSKVFSVSGFLEAFHFGLLKKELAVAGISIGSMLLVHWLRKGNSFEQFLARQQAVVRWSVYVVLVVWVLTFAQAGTEAFIYFQF